LEGDPPSPWEGPFAFSRVVKAGRFVLVGGTTSVDHDVLEDQHRSGLAQVGGDDR
jgi:hypothetical protein